MSYFPLAVVYEDRAFPETVNKAQEVRNNVGFKLISIFPSLGETLIVERVKYGWRVSDLDTYTIHNSRKKAIIQHFNRLAGR